MAYNTKSIVVDFDGKPAPQGFEPSSDSYKPQTLTNLGNNRYGIDMVIQKAPLKVVVEDVLITVAAGTTQRIDYNSLTYVDCDGYSFIGLAVQESTLTNHDFKLVRQPMSNTNRAFQLGNTFAEFQNDRGGWEQIKVVAPRERLYIQNLSGVSRSYYCSIYLTLS